MNPESSGNLPEITAALELFRRRMAEDPRIGDWRITDLSTAGGIIRIRAACRDRHGTFRTRTEEYPQPRFEKLTTYGSI